MNKGLFISLEGPDGSGKSTQVEYLKEFFASRRIPCIFTREPEGTKIGEKLRRVILDKENNEMCDMTEALLYAASRAQHVQELIRPALKRGNVVVCDRFLDSSIAYQGYGRKLGDSVREINKHAVMGCLPDLTFLIELDPGISKKRINKLERDRLENEKILFHKRVYRGYLEMAEIEPDRIKIVDGTKSREDIREAILERIVPLLQERNFI